jgi:hypothetical protein
MPELGISARGSYAIQEGSSISEVYHELAGMYFSFVHHNECRGCCEC